MEVRKATTADIDALIRLRQEQLTEEGSHPPRDISAELWDYFSRHILEESFLCWVAEEGATMIATAGMCLHQMPPSFENPSGKVGYITGMFTQRDYRKKGIGSLLLDYIIEEARALGCHTLRLQATPDGRGLYTRFGFLDAGSEMFLPLSF